MIDQLRINDRFSYDDFEASMKERSISEPKKKRIKDTVAYSNETYDFSSINGEVYWEERELEYVFEITADSPEELEEKKRKFLAWIMFVQSEELYDPFIEDYHFKATFESIDTDDSEIEKSTITVTFVAYPYMIANYATKYDVVIPVGEEKTVILLNESVHKIIPTVTATAIVIVEKGTTSFTIPIGTMTDEAFELDSGENTITISNTSEESCTLTIQFHAEVM